MEIDQSKPKFSQYELVEVATKLTSLIKAKRKVRVWKKGELPFFAKLSDLSKDQLSFDLVEKLPYELHEEDLVLVNFCFNDLDYFLKSIYINSSGSNLELKAFGKVYKAERRLNERLLTYPHMQVYAYMSLDDTNPSNLNKNAVFGNVLSFKREDDKVKKKLKDFLELGPSEDFLETEIESDVNLQGFRVMDLSPTGLSFCVNLESEAHYFNENDLKKKEVYISFNETSFILTNAKVMYSIDFVNPQTSVVPMKKVGMNFDRSQKFTDVIYNFIDDSNHTSELEKEFEQFVDD